MCKWLAAVLGVLAILSSLPAHALDADMALKLAAGTNSDRIAAVKEVIAAADVSAVPYLEKLIDDHVKVADGKFDPSDDGTRVRLSFADKSAVHLGLVSDDWATDAARDGTCVDYAVQAFPDISTFSAKWVTEPATGAPSSATRGLEVVPDDYLIQEHVDNLLTNGVCLEGYNAFGGAVYRNAAATYFAQFNATITTPQKHISDPTELIPASDRSDFITFVKSIHKL